MAKILKDLFLAMLNATLILVALCLVLLLLLVGKVNSLSDSFAEHLNVVGPLTQSVQDTGSEIAALRTDLAALRSQSQDLSSATMARIDARVTQMEERLQGMQNSMQDLRDAPRTLLNDAIDRAADQAVLGVARLRGCVPGEAPEQLPGS
ncbi:hypothetical protein I5535_11210 [Rhodobacteraceae bacterium F11138]|nr:hypothetical protein [Rhodobacteraceae bacterium F11138]